ncbi:MAG: NAD(P)/FAD-dependent oxidoreductase [Streptosporangiaceae bacterium]
MRILIIGAGVVGASTAYHLADAGADVAVVDRGGGGQATAAGAGIICPGLSGGHSEPWYAMACRGAGYYPELVDRLAADGETDLGYAVPGALFVAGRDEPLDDVHALVVEHRRAGVPAIAEVSRLNPREARELFPYLREELSAVHVSGAARVDGRRLRDGLLRAATRRGAGHRHGSAALLVSGDRVTGAVVDGEPMPADAVVVAAGAWTSYVCRPLGLGVAVRPQRGQILHLELAGGARPELPIVQSFSSHYLLGFAGGRVVAGATRETGSGFDARLTAAGVAEVLSEALRLAPGLGPATVAETRVGLRPMSDDGLPVLGSPAPGLVVATGMGPTGLTMGPYAGALAARLALDEPVPLDLTPYDPRRSPTEPGA